MMKPIKPGANVIKLFLSVIYGFLYKAIVFVKVGGGKFARDKHSSLVQNFVNYVRKMFHNIGTWYNKLKWNN